MRLTRPVTAPIVLVSALLVVGCGGSDTSDQGAAADDVAAADGSDDAASSVATDETDGNPGVDEPEASGASGDTTGDIGQDDPAGQAGPIDPSSLEPGTALVRVDGNEYRFVRGDSVFDVCEFEPDFDLGQAEMDLVDGPEAGSPHLQIGYGGDKQIVVLAVPPDIAYIAGKGEETDPYFRQFGVVPPTAGPIDVIDGGASGQITMMKVLADELVEATFAVRC